MEIKLPNIYVEGDSLCTHTLSSFHWAVWGAWAEACLLAFADLRMRAPPAFRVEPCAWAKELATVQLSRDAAEHILL